MLKISSPLLRAISFSACLFAGTATVGHAATITATGTVPGTCSVTGGNVLMAPAWNNTSLGKTAAPIGSASSTGPSGATLSLSKISFTEKPSTASPDLIATMSANLQLEDGTITDKVMRTNLDEGGTLSYNSPFNGTFRIEVLVGVPGGATPLAVGNYALATTLTCVVN